MCKIHWFGSTFVVANEAVLESIICLWRKIEISNNIVARTIINSCNECERTHMRLICLSRYWLAYCSYVFV